MLIEFTHKNGNLIFTLCLQNHTKNIKIGFMRLKTLKKMRNFCCFPFMIMILSYTIFLESNWKKKIVFVYVMFAISDQHANNI